MKEKDLSINTTDPPDTTNNDLLTLTDTDYKSNILNPPNFNFNISNSTSILPYIYTNTPLSYTNIIDQHTKPTKTKNLSYKTCLKNAIIIDLQDDRFNKEDAILIMDKYFQNAYSMKFELKKNILEAGFITPEEQDKALDLEVIYNNKKLRTQKLHHLTDIFTAIKATNVNVQTNINDTKKLIKQKLEQYGEIKDIFIPLINNKWQEPEATIYIKIKEYPPREVDLDGVPMLLNWKGAAPRCRFCKRSNHLVKDCRNLKRKLERDEVSKMEQLAKDAKIQTEQKQMQVDNSVIINNDSLPTTNKEIIDIKADKLVIPKNENKRKDISKLTEDDIFAAKLKIGPINLKKHLEEKKTNNPGSSLAGLSKQQKAAIKKNNQKVITNDDLFTGDYFTNE